MPPTDWFERLDLGSLELWQAYDDGSIFVNLDMKFEEYDQRGNG